MSIKKKVCHHFPWWRSPCTHDWKNPSATFNDQGKIKLRQLEPASSLEDCPITWDSRFYLVDGVLFEVFLQDWVPWMPVSVRVCFVYSPVLKSQRLDQWEISHLSFLFCERILSQQMSLLFLISYFLQECFLERVSLLIFPHSTLGEKAMKGKFYHPWWSPARHSKEKTRANTFWIPHFYLAFLRTYQHWNQLKLLFYIIN